MSVSKYGVLLFMLMGASVHGNPSQQDLSARFTTDLYTPEVQHYFPAFIREATFIRECTPLDGKRVEPFTVYVEVKADGRVGRLTAYPQLKVADCVVDLLGKRKFRAPPREMVLRIDVNFTPAIGDFLKGIDSHPFEGPNVAGSPREKCEFFSVEGSKTITGPGLPEGGEFSIYTLYFCRRDQSLVLWRTRAGGQLVGELRMPQEVLAPAKAPGSRKQQPDYIVAIAECKTSTGEPVDAIYGGPDWDRPLEQLVLLAWRVDVQNKALVPVRAQEVAECVDERE